MSKSEAVNSSESRETSATAEEWLSNLRSDLAADRESLESRFPADFVTQDEISFREAFAASDQYISADLSVIETTAKALLESLETTLDTYDTLEAALLKNKPSADFGARWAEDFASLAGIVEGGRTLVQNELEWVTEGKARSETGQFAGPAEEVLGLKVMRKDTDVLRDAEKGVKRLTRGFTETEAQDNGPK